MEPSFAVWATTYPHPGRRLRWACSWAGPCHTWDPSPEPFKLEMYGLWVR